MENISSSFSSGSSGHSGHSKSLVRDFFLYLFTVGTLYVCVGTFLNLLFEYIDRLFPDLIDYSFVGYSTSIRLSIASLIILFPIYVSLTWFLRKDTIAHPEKRDYGVRKFLFYLTLFLAAIAIVADLVTLIFHFLEGELTIRFFLKVLVVLIVAAAVFGYYFWDMRRETLPTSRPSKAIAWSACVIVFGTIFAGFFIIGSPFTERIRKIDQLRVQDLQQIQNTIIYNYWTLKGKLPAKLSDLEDDISGFRVPKDRESGNIYEYRVKGKQSFELCATFQLESIDDSSANFYEHGWNPDKNENWKHSAGRVCFARTIDPQLYPPKEKIPVPEAVPVID